MTRQAVSFYSEGTRLSGELYLPEGLAAGERRSGIVLCHGYTAVRNLYLPDTARALTEAGYVVLTFENIERVCPRESRFRGHLMN